MALDARPSNHRSGVRAVSSSGSHSFLRKLTSFTKRSRHQPLAAAPSPYSTARTPLPTPPSSPPSSSSSSAPNKMALAAAQTASLNAATSHGLPTPPSTARPASSTRPVSRPVSHAASHSVSHPASRPASSTVSRPRISAPVDVTCKAPLVVQVEICFPGLDGPRTTPSYTNEYASSPNLHVSSRLCKGLLRRLVHCSTELITRRDSLALMQQQRHGHAASAKPLAYALHFRILCKDTGLWADKTFCSYQQHAMSHHDAHEVILATHRMVGLFLRRHDPAFQWSDAPAAKQFASFVPRPEALELVPHTVGRPLPLSCIPRSRFLDESQSFEFVPGYAIKLSFRSRCPARKQYEWKRAISVPSNQSTPLNLAHAEDVLWQAFSSVNSALSVRRQAFAAEHGACDFLEGVASCRHFDEDALDIELSVHNNLGPDYSHLTRTISSKLALFSHADGTDCQEFVHSVHNQLVHSRDAADSRVSALPDFDYRITTVKTLAWSLDHPARFVLNASNSYSRRSIEAILDRVETGITDVLRNKGCQVHVVAYKRGHLILDKSIVTGSPPAKPALFPKAPAAEDADELSANLKERIFHDIDAVCKDTCTLDAFDSIDDLQELASFADSSFLPMTPRAEKFDNTVILGESAIVDDEPILPAPRVVELPEGVYLGDSRTSSPASSTRRRAFPLVPEKFALPRSIDSMSRASTPPIQEDDELAEMPAGNPAEVLPGIASQSSEEPAFAADLLNKTLADSPVESPTEVFSDIPAEVLPDIAALLPDSPAEEPAVAADLLEKNLVESPMESPTEIFAEVPEVPAKILEVLPEIPASPALGDIITVEEIPVMDEVDSDLVDAVPEPLQAANVEDMVGEIEYGSSESSYKSLPDCKETNCFSSDSENVLASIESTEDELPRAPRGFVGDGDAEPEEPVQELQEQAQEITFDAPPVFYNFDDCKEATSVELRFGREDSPTVGTQLESVEESDDETRSEFELTFPAYEQGLPYVPCVDSLQAASAVVPPAVEVDDTPVPKCDLDYVPQPVLEPEVIRADVATDGPEFEVEPLSFSSPRHSHTDQAGITRKASVDLTPPSTPPPSLSSGGFNSPETSFLETPGASREVPTMFACFDSDTETQYEHEHEHADESGPQFAPFADPKPISVELIADIAAHQDMLPDETIVVSSPTSCGVSESDSTPTEVWRGLEADTTVADQHSHPESDLEACILSAPEPSFEDFAMSESDMDLDEGAEVGGDELTSDDSELTLLAAIMEVEELLVSDERDAAATPVQMDVIDRVSLVDSERASLPEDGKVVAAASTSGLSPLLQPALLSELDKDIVIEPYSVDVDAISELDLSAITPPDHDREVVDELALFEGGAPSEGMIMSHDVPVESEVQTNGWLALMDAEVEDVEVFSAEAEEVLPDVDIDDPAISSIKCPINVFDYLVDEFPDEASVEPSVLDCPVVIPPTPPESELATEDHAELPSMVAQPVPPVVLPPRSTWCLPKAGLVGLDESRLARVGLRGALTGSHAFDAVSHVPDADIDNNIDDGIDDGIDDSIDLESADDVAEVTSSPTAEATPAATPTTATKVKELPPANPETTVPRVAVAFASLVVITQMISRSSSS